MEDVEGRTKERKTERRKREKRGGLHSSGGFYEKKERKKRRKKRGEAGQKTSLSLSLSLWEEERGGEQPPSLGNEASPERFAKEWCTRGLHPLSRAMKKHGRRRGRGRGRRVGRFCHRIHYRLSAYQVSISSSGRSSRKFLRLLFFLPLSFFFPFLLSLLFLFFFNFFPCWNLNCRLKISRRPWMMTELRRRARHGLHWKIIRL